MRQFLQDVSRWRSATMLAALAFLLLPLPVTAQPTACTPPPEGAVVALPAPLSKWGSLICTQFGYVIAAKPGWLWSQPTAYAPVFVPAQMVRDDPAPLGSAAYFSKIELFSATGPEYEAAKQAAFAGFDKTDDKNLKGYRLDVTSNSGKSLQLFFFEDDKSRWGIWCPNGKCDQTTLFMILDMSKRR